MASTNKTTVLELSQFVGSDIPGWLTDYNSDMSKIDAFAAGVDSDVSGAVQTANSANATAQAASTAANQAVTTAGQANAGVNSIISKNVWVKSIIGNQSEGIFSNSTFTQYYNDFLKMFYVTGEGTINDGVGWPSNGYVALGQLSGYMTSNPTWISNGACFYTTNNAQQESQKVQIAANGSLFVYASAVWPSPTTVNGKRIQVSFCVPLT